MNLQTRGVLTVSMLAAAGSLYFTTPAEAQSDECIEWILENGDAAFEFCGGGWYGDYDCTEGEAWSFWFICDE